MIRVNNRDKIEWENGMTVSRLLERMRYAFAHLVVKVDGRVVAPEEYAVYPIPDGADVWVIHLIAGG